MYVVHDDIRFLYSFHIYYAKSFVRPKFLSWWCSLRGKTATTTTIFIHFVSHWVYYGMYSSCEEAIYRDNTSFHYFWFLWCWILFCDSYTNAHNSSMFWKEENGGHVNFAEREYFIQYDVEYIKTSMRNPMWMYKRWNENEYNLMMELRTHSLE